MDTSYTPPHNEKYLYIIYYIIINYYIIYNIKFHLTLYVTKLKIVM
jgi:hypothetical protein